MNAIDTLVRSLTAFASWNDMAAAMQNGYIPTLNGGKAYAKLAGICQRNGYRIYRSGRVA